MKRRPSLLLAAFALLSATALGACFGARPALRSYFVLAGEPGELDRRAEPLFRGLVRVRNLNAEDIYDKFQIVVRRSPYELRYSDSNVWAVKPYQMVSDIIARRLLESNTFAAATRELGDQRPEMTLGGELHAIEIYDSNDVWFAHLALTLTLDRFSDGERLWSMRFDERKLVSTATFSHAVRTLSELLDEALKRGSGELERVSRGERIVPVLTPSLPAQPKDEAPKEKKDAASDEEPIYVPEKEAEPPPT